MNQTDTNDFPEDNLRMVQLSEYPDGTVLISPLPSLFISNKLEFSRGGSILTVRDSKYSRQDPPVCQMILSLFLGVVVIEGSKYFVFCENAKLVGQILGHKVYRICSVKFRAVRQEFNPSANRATEMLRAKLCSGFYFSPSMDLTKPFDPKSGLSFETVPELTSFLLNCTETKGWRIPLVRGFFINLRSQTQPYLSLFVRMANFGVSEAEIAVIVHEKHKFMSVRTFHLSDLSKIQSLKSKISECHTSQTPILMLNFGLEGPTTQTKALETFIDEKKDKYIRYSYFNTYSASEAERTERVFTSLMKFEKILQAFSRVEFDSVGQRQVYQSGIIDILFEETFTNATFAAVSNMITSNLCRIFSDQGTILEKTTTQFCEEKLGYRLSSAISELIDGLSLHMNGRVFSASQNVQKLLSKENQKVINKTSDDQDLLGFSPEERKISPERVDRKSNFTGFDLLGLYEEEDKSNQLDIFDAAPSKNVSPMLISESESKGQIDQKSSLKIKKDLATVMETSHMTDAMGRFAQYFDTPQTTSVITIDLKTGGTLANQALISQEQGMRSELEFKNLLTSSEYNPSIEVEKNNICSARLLVLTWNSSDLSPGENYFRIQKLISSIQESNADIVVFGLQDLKHPELKLEKLKNIFSSQKRALEWEVQLKVHLPDYEIVQQKGIFGVHLFIMEKKGFQEKISFENDWEFSNPYNRFSDKGAVMIVLSIGETKLAFANCHFTSGKKEEKVRERFLELESIFKECMSRLDGKKYLCFLLGCFGFGVRLPQETIVNNLSLGETFQIFQEVDDWSFFVRENSFMKKWKEETVNFAPTYKYNIDTFEMVTKGGKGPGWPDRVIFREEGAKFFAEEYKAEKVSGSDHLPVILVGTFEYNSK